MKHIKLTQHENGKLTEVKIGKIVLYFSYETVVAFYDYNTHQQVVSENIWTNTTGKHLNAIDGGNKKSRVEHDTFLKLLENATDPDNRVRRRLGKAI